MASCPPRLFSLLRHLSRQQQMQGGVIFRNSTTFSKTALRQNPQQQQQQLGGKVVMFAVVSGLTGASIFYIMMSSSSAEGGKEGERHLLHRKSESEKRKLTPREKRFIKFASVEYDGQIYMTPQDFLESVVEGEPRPRFKRRRLTDKDVGVMQGKLGRLSKNNDQFFRHLGNQGIISFSEYLFLLTILIKPQSGFKIAFAMLDQDGNERIDKNEFKVLESVFSSAAKERRQIEQQKQQQEEASQGAENDSSNSKSKSSSSSIKLFDDDEHGLQRVHKVDTSLLVYFFGKRGDEQLKFDDFHRFMENLQTEVLEMEYQEFSKGARTITELDFARILLRYTFLNTEEYDTILDRVVDRLQDSEVGITFAEFRDFCIFLNNLDDFQIAMRMYTLAEKAISEEEFTRAVTVCTGRGLSPHLVHTVFQIFDSDGDGLLSYQEFVAMMKDRVNRGLKTFSRQEGWSGFKKCVKQEVKAA